MKAEELEEGSSYEFEWINRTLVGEVISIDEPRKGSERERWCMLRTKEGKFKVPCSAVLEPAKAE